MRSRRRIQKRVFSITLIFLIILTVSVCFGQVLGNFYLTNINKETLPSSVESNIKIKALRLNKFDYYCVLAGTYTIQEQALSVGNSLAQKGLPAVISGGSPYTVLLGFVNNPESLLPLADSIQVDGQKAIVQKGEVNTVSFKFEAKDSFAGGQVAPFLGSISVCLNKGLLLYTGVSAHEDTIQQFRPKFSVLALELQDLAKKGTNLAASEQAATFAEALSILALRCRKWAESLQQLEKQWQDINILVSQQQALALLEDYGCFLADTN